MIIQVAENEPTVITTFPRKERKNERETQSSRRLRCTEVRNEKRGADV